MALIFIDSFNGKFWAECLNAHWFTSFDDARRKMQGWRRDYNEVRPHSAIGYKPLSSRQIDSDGLAKGSGSNLKIYNFKLGSIHCGRSTGTLAKYNKPWNVSLSGWYNFKGFFWLMHSPESARQVMDRKVFGSIIVIILASITWPINVFFYTNAFGGLRPFEYLYLSIFISIIFGPLFIALYYRGCPR